MALNLMMSQRRLVLATLPGRLRDWSDDIVASKDQLTRHDLIAKPEPELPDDGLAVMLLDDPATAIGDLMIAGLGALDAARRLALVLLGLSNISQPTSLRSIVRAADEDSAALRQRLRTVFSFGDDTTEVKALAQPHSPADKLAFELIDGYAVPLQAYAMGRSQICLRWPRASFLLGDPPHDVVPERIELVGPTRVLVYGPYLYLPCGQWEAELQLYFSNAACRRTFTVDMITQDIIGTIRLRPSRAGLFRTRMVFHHSLVDWPVALRVVLDHGAIEGRFSLESVSLYWHRTERPYSVP